MPLSAWPSNYNLRSVKTAEREAEENLIPEQEPDTLGRMASLRLEQFNGTDNIESYIRRFKDYCSVMKLSSEQQLATLRWHLGGVARLWYESLEIEPTNVDDLIAKLKDKFKTDCGVDINLFSMRQSPGETVENFLDRLEIASYKYKVDQKLQVQIALSGMDANISTALSTHAPNSLTKVRQLVRRIHNVMPAPVVAQTTPSKVEATMDILVAAVQQLTTAVKTRKNQDNRQERTQDCSRCGGRCYSTKTCKAMGKNCYKCGGLNHFGNKCRSSKKQSYQNQYKSHNNK